MDGRGGWSEWDWQKEKRKVSGMMDGRPRFSISSFSRQDLPPTQPNQQPKRRQDLV